MDTFGKSTECINILYSTDERYSLFTMVSILSVLKNNPNESFLFHLLGDNLSAETRSMINDLVGGHGSNLELYDLDDIDFEVGINDDFPRAGYGRLFITDRIEQDKLIYLDADTYVGYGIRGLWDIDIADVCFGAVQDTVLSVVSESVGIQGNSRYVNSGVLLMNLDRIRQNGYSMKIREFIKRFNGRVPHHDQGVINGVFRDEIKYIHPKYNLMPQFFMYTSKQIKTLYRLEVFYEQSEVDTAIKEVVIVHFIRKFYGRPWELGCSHPLKESFRELIEEVEPEYKFERYAPSVSLYLRGLVYNRAPFFMHLLFERILDLRRKKRFNKDFSWK